MFRWVTAVLGTLLIASMVFYWRRGPTYWTEAQQLSWTPLRPGGSSLRVLHSEGDIDFLSGDDLALRRGMEAIASPGLTGFSLVGTYAGTIWAVGRGPRKLRAETVILLTSRDGGRSFVALGPIPIPTGGSSVDGWIVRGDEIELQFVGSGPLADAWSWPWSRGYGRVAALLRPSVGPRSALRSKNGGRSWRLER